MHALNTKTLIAVSMLVAGLVLPLHSSPATAPAEADDRIQVIFAPQSDCLGGLVKAIHAAKNNLKIQMNDLTSDAIARELVAARDRGVFVRILLGANASPDVCAAARPLLEKDHLVRVDTMRYSPHHVTIIVDDALLLTGVVQTLADQAAPVDQHLMLVKQMPDVIQRYIRHWMQRAEKSRLFHEVTLDRSAAADAGSASAIPPPRSEPKDTVSNADNVEQMVYVTSSGKRYHTTNCRYARYGRPMSLQEAVAQGMTPCKVCKPDAKP